MTVVLVPELLELALIVRFGAEMIPFVTVLAYSLPIGEPIAKTSWPALIELELPNLATVVTLAALIFKTARSVVESVPTSSAWTFLPLLMITCSALAPETT